MPTLHNGTPPGILQVGVGNSITAVYICSESYGVWSNVVVVAGVVKKKFVLMVLSITGTCDCEEKRTVAQVHHDGLSHLS